MQYFTSAWLLATLLSLSTLQVHAEPATDAEQKGCGKPKKNYGKTQVVLYNPSPKCKGRHQTRTVTGPAISKHDYSYGRCYPARDFASMELHKTSEGIAQNCEIEWWINESCTGSRYGIDTASAGTCFDTRAIFEKPKSPSQSFKFVCSGDS